MFIWHQGVIAPWWHDHIHVCCLKLKVLWILKVSRHYESHKIVLVNSTNVFLDFHKVQKIIRKHHQTFLQLFWMTYCNTYCPVANYHYVHNLWQNVPGGVGGGGGGGDSEHLHVYVWVISWKWKHFRANC